MLTQQPSPAFDRKFAKKLKIAIVRANYHTELVTNLETFAKATLITAGVNEKNIKTYTVPGCWETPLLVKHIAQAKKVHAILVFGIIVKGKTYNFEMLANEVTSALMQLSIDYSLPIANKILAVYDQSHAELSAGKDTNNKGIEAANAVLQTILTLHSIKK